MKIFFALFLSLFMVYTTTAQKQVVVDPNAEIRPLQGTFNKIKISNGIDLHLSQSSAESLAVSASEQKYKERIKTVIENNVLKIYFDDDKAWRKNSNRMLKAYVSFKELEELDASGASDIIVTGSIEANSFKLNMSGASDFSGDIQATHLSIILSNASDIFITGKTTTTKIESSGASDINGYKLSTDFCSANASGASDIYITVNEIIEANASGASNIYYRGNAVLKEMHSTRTSNIRKKG